MVAASRPDAVVVFDASDELAADVMRQAKDSGIAIRVVNVRRWMLS
jgi:hypothetical protein